MSPSDVSRGDLTAHLLTKIRAELVCGDAEAPEEGGWDDNPSLPTSSFQAYSVLTPMPSGDGTGPVSDSSADWILPYRIDNYGISREQCEFQADRTRALIRPTKREQAVLGGENYRIQQVRTTSLGGIGKENNVEPTEYSQSDTIAVHITKEF